MSAIYSFNRCTNFYINVYNVVMVAFEILGELSLKLCSVNTMGNENHTITKKLRTHPYVTFPSHKEVGETTRGEAILRPQCSSERSRYVG